MGSKFFMTPILVDILAPPRIAKKGLSGSSRACFRYFNSFCNRKPAPEGKCLGTPDVEACALWTVPKASWMNTSASEASCLAKVSLFVSSPAWKRRFSRSRTPPPFNSPTIFSTSGPMQSGAIRTSRLKSSPNLWATGFKLNFGSTFPLGRPIWDIKITRHSLPRAYLIVGRAA